METLKEVKADRRRYTWSAMFGTNLTSIQINFSQETTVNGKSPPRKREGSKEDKQRAEKPKHREVQKLSKEDSKQSSPKKSKEGTSTK
jgi:hypothetical protein